MADVYLPILWPRQQALKNHCPENRQSYELRERYLDEFQYYDEDNNENEISEYLEHSCDVFCFG